MIICYFGDSLTAGYGDPSGLGWAGRISGKLATMGVDVTHYNLGVRKDAGPLVARRWKGEAELRKMKGLEFKLVFSFGVADTVNKYTLADTREAARAILTEAKEMGEVLVVGPTPVTDSETTRKIGTISDELAAICAELEVPFVPTVDAMQASPLYLDALKDGDNIHPTLPGYAALAAHILQSEPTREFFGLE